MTRSSDLGNNMAILSEPQQAEARFRPQTLVPRTWQQILDALPNHKLAGTEAEPQVTGASLNSRTTLPGDLYLALPGAKTHGADHAATAINAGAVAILTDAVGATKLGSSCPVPVIVVDEPRSVVGTLSQQIYAQPDGIATPLFGVTGTNGKTTTSYFIDAVLAKLNIKTALVGTIETRVGGTAIPSALTTPEATQLHALFSRLREENGAAAVMEVSSHAINFQRISGLEFEVAGFTNLTQDHLDLHRDMQSYFDVKAQLFEAGRTGTAVIITDGGPDGYGQKMAQRAEGQLVRLCTDGSDDQAHWQVLDSQQSGLGHTFTLKHRDGTTIHTGTALPGDFNVANAALAAVMVLSADPNRLDTSTAEIISVLENDHPFDAAVPGRMEVVTEEPAGVVDFAHNPDAMIRTMTALKEAGATRLILVFGATGERDATKREIMGAIAAEHADVIIVSDDDPHGEDPATIRAQVMAGAQEWIRAHKADRTLVEISPRSDAITYAANVATPSDTILLAGRGHETAMDMAGTVVPIDDRDELRHAVQLAKKRAASR